MAPPTPNRSPLAPKTLLPDEQVSLLRIMDANGNRCVEGLRVAEDYFRFHRNDAFLSRLCKQLRHQVSETLTGMLDETARLVARSTRTDVGTTATTNSEYTRDSLLAVAHANLNRATEALRALEEFSKTVDTSAARVFEAVRYETYTLAKSLVHLVRSVDRLRFDDSKMRRSLYVLMDLSFGAETLSRLEQLIAGGVDFVQLRDKDASDRELIEAAKSIRKITSEQNVLLVINDRPDVAHLVCADAVHVGQDEMSVADVRSVVGSDMLVGVSTHDIQQAEKAVLDGADYIGVGPVFPSQTKAFNEHVGLDFVRSVSQTVSLPTYAIGGISLDTLRSLLDAGVKGVAASHAIWHAEQPEVAARKWKQCLVEQDKRIED